MFELREISTGKIIKRTKKMPTIDGSVPIGLDPDLEWLELKLIKPFPEFNEEVETLEYRETRVGNTIEKSYIKVSL